ncbi:N-acetyltransferase [Brevibacillus centrosporus]|uniref:Acetoin utilization protein AcuA n=1 Tax=Brevibacillus centrosporus TaxID=54910 RepID=A0A1I3VXA7_9BACL|nr:N-acetyltransferase [Brevibacillus centrosporus]MEC2130658.1 N-acetyltransferase [Brevibacillus centrosporus]MED4908251.1 N-acetyltransferase [Brevibacillus centrosporus]RNB69301.1 N-acetyltransferase [Brevibacillus centrosporus]SFJ99800.1 acetoin utilization protein AcuA [Brevibacillus centrosporus]GED33349.1 acetoin utilization protein AcuA [Brevibacillus centrosporus]
MEHVKRYHSLKTIVNGRELLIEGPISGSELASYRFDDGLIAFRIPEQQHQALIEIADLPEGRIIVAREDDLVLGYVTFLHPDPLERWSQAKLPDLLELGAIEISHLIRAGGVAKKLLEVSFADDAMEDYIIITTEYYWHWDLKGTGLDVWQYRKVMEKVMGSVGMVWMATDDPEICSHPANCLMARIGKRVPPESVEAFDGMRFQNRFLY